MAGYVGQQFGNYRLIQLLGAGGFAEVYLGEHIHLGTQAAIKLLHTQLATNDLEQFRAEARTIARLIHPHIVRVLEFGVEKQIPFLVMDHAPYGTLRQRHQRGIPVPLPLIVSYVKQVADALQHAHGEKVIHRDIKPENMLLGRHNDVLLSDFGIALVMQSSDFKSLQSIAGTMMYMAPEQIQGKPQPASDQYSLGIVVYEWLSGQRPFQGSLPELAGQHLSASPPSLREKVPTLSTAIEQAVFTALAKDPKGRFTSIQAFANALEQACQVGQITSLPPPRVQGTNESSRPRSSMTPSNQSSLPSHTVIAASSGQGLETTDQGAPPRRQLEPTNPTISGNRQSRSSTFFTTPNTVPATPSGFREPVQTEQSQQSLPSQSRITRRTALVSIIGLTGVGIAGGGIAWLAHSQRPQGISSALHATTPHPTPVSTLTPTPTPAKVPLGTTLYNYTGHDAGLRALAWSPNGKRVATASDDATAQVWDATTGGNAVIYHGHSSYVEGVAWSPDGALLVTGSADGTAQVWNADTGNHIYTYPGHMKTFPGSAYQTHPWVNRVDWSHNGKYIVSCDQTSDPSRTATVQVWEATTGNTITTYRGHTNGIYAVAWSPQSNLIASAGYDGTLQIWEAMTGSNSAIYRDNAYLFGLSWSPDSKSVAVGSSDNLVLVIDAASGNMLSTYQGHANWVKDVSWSPNGQHIASGSDDGSVRLWSSATGAPVYSYNGHSGHVNAVGWSPDGALIASGGDTVQVWAASS